MAFESALTGDEEQPLTYLEEEVVGGGDKVLRVLAGTDTVTGELISVGVCLNVMMGKPDCYELAFFIGKSEPYGDRVYSYWDGRGTKAFIPERADRDLIMGATLACIERLIDLVQPPSVIMVTHGANLPAKALIKYEAVNRLFAAKGYYAGQLDPYHGKRAWLMQRHDG